MSVIVWRSAAAAIAVGLTTAATERPAPAEPAPVQRAAYLPLAGGAAAQAQLAELGRVLFFDPALSASGRLSCASCHDPAHGHAPGNDLAVQPNGAGRSIGFRATPSLRYLQALPPFEEHHHENDGDSSIDAGPTGGHMWDGRARSAHEQARLPLLSASEMANPSAAALAARLRTSAQAARLRSVFGAGVLDDAEGALAAVGMALEVYQQTPAVFYPYSSKYDDVLRGRVTLTAQEARGLAAFEDPARGNCAACHPSGINADGAFPLFTDFGHIALGLPRNRSIVANADPQFHDLGLCGPLRSGFGERPENAGYCGAFRTPSLRNVAVRGSLFHNGVFHTLEDAVRFYAERDTRPQAYYARDAQGRVQLFDDLPPAYRGNVNTEAPFGARPGERAPLTDADIRDIVAFLRTLTDADLQPAAR